MFQVNCSIAQEEYSKSQVQQQCSGGCYTAPFTSSAVARRAATRTFGVRSGYQSSDPLQPWVQGLSKQKEEGTAGNVTCNFRTCKSSGCCRLTNRGKGRGSGRRGSFVLAGPPEATAGGGGHSCGRGRRAGPRGAGVGKAEDTWRGP